MEIDNEAVKTVLGALLLVGFVALIIWRGPLNILGDLVAQVVVTVIGIVGLVVVLGFFAGTGIGAALGGITTGLVLILVASFVMIGIGVYQGNRKREEEHDDSDVF
ncbi:MAG: hypothetical protein AAGJ28_12650 [Pseudomonadota bacterium]